MLVVVFNLAYNYPILFLMADCLADTDDSAEHLQSAACKRRKIYIGLNYNTFKKLSAVITGICECL